MSTFSPSPDPSFPVQNTFSWPIFILVLLIHTAFITCLFIKSTASTTSSSSITPPMVGVLIAPGSFANIAASVSHQKQAATTYKKIETKSNKATALPHQNKNKELQSDITTQIAHGKVALSHEGTSSDGLSNHSKGENDHLSGMNSFFSPRVDAAYAHNPKPTYPLASRRMGEEGTVILSVYILASGSVDKILLKKSSGYPRLDKAAMTGVKNWHYVPAKKGNTPIAVWHTQAIRFSLKD